MSRAKKKDVILSEAKDLLLRSQKQILRFAQDDICTTASISASMSLARVR
jgi:hypothetical protein